MAVLIFRLNGVSDEEAEEVRQLLSEHDFEYYETSAGRWGVSVAALWLVDDKAKDDARAVIDAYQTERSRRAGQEWSELPSHWQRFSQAPVATLAVLLLALGVLAASILPFLW